MGLDMMIGGAILVFLFLIGSYFYTNMTYIKKPLAKMYNAGFTEKQMKLRDGTVLNYGEGPDNGQIPLLLIHGQGMNWKDYAKVLPELSKHYHVYAVDCHGHGGSDKNPKKYSAKEISKDFIEFIKAKIGKKTVISGHSSGGMIAAWIASHSSDLVLGVVIEDSPFFATEPGKQEKTYAWVYDFKLYQDFKNQNKVKDYFTYYLKHNYWRKVFGNLLWNRFSKDAQSYKEKNPNEPVHLFYLPPTINRIFESVTYPYDRRFGETFYDNTWFEDYNQALVLSKIKSPTIFIKAATKYDEDLLLAALSDKDADKVVELLENGKRINIDSPGHDIHYDKPKEFTEIMVNFLEDVQL
ncbi:Pimeloyl-ACP methyl ester carboxylesterase [Seinonella peptonophila]|uniref:Pimeloyl-ACP methyl ester carboxylesterase n=1 Tax=Seinonella peptonophila TaxID=112248 RepID=A0A1M4SU01_9BACL|nr:alpha/beta hydrolase [Seinonella peptonophila]SHE35720.1 Pimeloyl-ACP methyl ester carboxylesterase [Seinonella peptonophila]